MSPGLGNFSWRETKDGRVRISRSGRVVATLGGEAARSFLSRAKDADEEAVQHLLAGATGNYKRGNERP
jgi:hypothetical protein